MNGQAAPGPRRIELGIHAPSREGIHNPPPVARRRDRTRPLRFQFSVLPSVPLQQANSVLLPPPFPLQVHVPPEATREPICPGFGRASGFALRPQKLSASSRLPERRDHQFPQGQAQVGSSLHDLHRHTPVDSGVPHHSTPSYIAGEGSRVKLPAEAPMSAVTHPRTSTPKYHSTGCAVSLLMPVPAPPLSAPLRSSVANHPRARARAQCARLPAVGCLRGWAKWCRGAVCRCR